MCDWKSLWFPGFVRSSSESLTPGSKRVYSELEHANKAPCLDDLSTRLACSQPEAPTTAAIDAIVVSWSSGFKCVSHAYVLVGYWSYNVRTCGVVYRNVIAYKGREFTNSSPVVEVFPFAWCEGGLLWYVLYVYSIIEEGGQSSLGWIVNLNDRSLKVDDLKVCQFLGWWQSGHWHGQLFTASPAGPSVALPVDAGNPGQPDTAPAPGETHDPDTGEDEPRGYHHSLGGTLQQDELHAPLPHTQCCKFDGWWAAIVQLSLDSLWWGRYGTTYNFWYTCAETCNDFGQYSIGVCNVEWHCNRFGLVGGRPWENCTGPRC